MKYIILFIACAIRFMSPTWVGITEDTSFLSAVMLIFAFFIVDAIEKAAKKILDRR